MIRSTDKTRLQGIGVQRERQKRSLIFHHEILEQLSKEIIHDVRTLRECGIDRIELPTIVEDLIHITNKITDGFEFLTQHFVLQCRQICKEQIDRIAMRASSVAYPSDL